MIMEVVAFEDGGKSAAVMRYKFFNRGLGPTI